MPVPRTAAKTKAKVATPLDIPGVLLLVVVMANQVAQEVLEVQAEEEVKLPQPMNPMILPSVLRPLDANQKTPIKVGATINTVVTPKGEKVTRTRGIAAKQAVPPVNQVTVIGVTH